MIEAAAASAASGAATRLWERLGRSQTELEPPAAVYRRLRLQMLEAERGVDPGRPRRGPLDDVVLRGALAAIDLEESMLDRVEDAAARLDDELVTSTSGPATASTCDAAPRGRDRRDPERLRGLPARGHDLGASAAVPDLRQRRLLRLLASRRHATAHFHETSTR